MDPWDRRFNTSSSMVPCSTAASFENMESLSYSDLGEIREQYTAGAEREFPRRPEQLPVERSPPLIDQRLLGTPGCRVGVRVLEESRLVGVAGFDGAIRGARLIQGLQTEEQPIR